MGWTSALFAGATCCAQAQQYALTPPEAQEAGPQHRFDAQRDDMLAKFLNVGPLHVRPHFVGAAFYDDNISLAPEGQGREILKDLVWSLSPGVTAAIGDFHAGKRGNFLALDYTPTATLYTEHGEFNALDHHVQFDGGWRGSKLALGVGQGYRTGSGGFVETGGQVEREVFNTGLTTSYQFTDKTSFDLNGRQSISSYETRNDSNAGNADLDSRNEWTIEGLGTYKFSDKLKLGAGVVAGWRDIRNSPNESYQQLLARGGYLVTEKIDVSLAMGAQWSQFQGGLEDGPKFVFDLGGTWQVRERTSLSLDLFRREVSSVAFNSQSYTVLGFRAGVRQTIAQKWVAGLAGGFEHSDYFKTTSETTTGDSQDNDYWFVGPALDYNFSDQWTVGLFYQYRKKDSDDPSFGFANNQTGLRTTFRF